METKQTSLFSLIGKHRLKIMGFAAIWIIIYHTWKTSFNNIPLLFEIEYVIKNLGDCGVDIFLFISGIGMPFSYKKETKTGSFYLKRIKRLFIPFIVIFLSNSIIKNWTVKQILINSSGYGFLFNSVYTYQWFFFAIIILILLFPLYYKIISKQKSIITFTIKIIVIYFALLFLFKNYLRNDLYLFLNRIPIFLVGVSFSMTENKKCFANNRYTFILSLIVMIIGLYLAIQNKANNLFELMPLFYASFPYMLLAISLSIILSIIFELFSKISLINKIFTFYGKMSFELYCVQELVDNYKNIMILPLPLNNFMFFIIITIFSTILFQINNLIIKKQ